VRGEARLGPDEREILHRGLPLRSWRAYTRRVWVEGDLLAYLEPLGVVERNGRGWTRGERRYRWALRELDPPPLSPIALARARSVPLAA
jgi:hypothetical protein